MHNVTRIARKANFPDCVYFQSRYITARYIYARALGYKYQLKEDYESRVVSRLAFERYIVLKKCRSRRFNQLVFSQ